MRVRVLYPFPASACQRRPKKPLFAKEGFGAICPEIGKSTKYQLIRRYKIPLGPPLTKGEGLDATFCDTPAGRGAAFGFPPARVVMWKTPSPSLRGCRKSPSLPKEGFGEICPGIGKLCQDQRPKEKIPLGAPLTKGEGADAASCDTPSEGESGDGGGIWGSQPWSRGLVGGSGKL